MGKQYEEEEIEIDLKELILEILSHWSRILIAIVLAAGIFFACSFFLITPMYTSTSILYVLSSSTSITSVADIQIGSYLTTDYIEVVSGRPVLDQVIENLDLDLEYDEFYEKVTLSNPDDSRLLEITVEDEDPEQAKLIADEIAEVAAVYISEKMDQDPPSIIQYGYVADEPSSPSILKNTAIGGIAGLVISVLLICITYLMNDTITSPDDLEKKIGLNVLASLPDEGRSDYDGEKKRSRRRRSA